MLSSDNLFDAFQIRESVLLARTSIYAEPALANEPEFYNPEQLEVLLSHFLVGSTELSGLPVRTRSKVAKTLVAQALGYDVPLTFQRTQPRLPHPNIDVYAQQANNLQVWNAELDASRRYVIIGLDSIGHVHAVRVIAGANLAAYDTTGTLTSKFQAARKADLGSKLVGGYDTPSFRRAMEPSDDVSAAQGTSPITRPHAGQVVSIAGAYGALSSLVGRTFRDPGLTQERLRGEVIHRATCQALHLSSFADQGQFPDIKSQVIEVKLQLARTVDLGLELPSSETPIASLDGVLSARDVRYALFYGERVDQTSFTITSLVLTTGADFFSEYQQFRGKVSNSKLQLRLPVDFYS
ncbi:hypothetical protein [Rathayibacter rathayi]|uniref:hypothetical protein n=1 Tax=Rathayibacter rathayi TaxID=33887 RepID=UPI0011B069FF|nr:hypothetical protein [Rathayibacter rathayi]